MKLSGRRAYDPMTEIPKVGIVVLNYRGRDCLLPCLASLSALDYPNVEIFVVDNASGDGSADAAQNRYPAYGYQRLVRNVGFAAGMNWGIRMALAHDCEYVWLFNNDAVAEPDSLSRLMDQARLPNMRRGLFSPKILEVSTDAVWFEKGAFNFWRMRTEHREATAVEKGRKAYPSAFLTGCALLIAREVIESVGLLDESYFLYYEDAEYSLRARQAGFECVVVPAARVSHGERSLADESKVYYLVLSGILFFKRNMPFWMRPYLTVYLGMRKLKNRADLFFGTNASEAALVKKAYDDSRNSA